MIHTALHQSSTSNIKYNFFSSFFLQIGSINVESHNFQLENEWMDVQFKSVFSVRLFYIVRNIETSLIYFSSTYLVYMAGTLKRFFFKRFHNIFYEIVKQQNSDCTQLQDCTFFTTTTTSSSTSVISVIFISCRTWSF